MWVDRRVGRQVERQTDGVDSQGGWDISVHGGTWRAGAMYRAEQRHGRSNDMGGATTWAEQRHGQSNDMGGATTWAQQRHGRSDDMGGVTTWAERHGSCRQSGRVRQRQWRAGQCGQVAWAMAAGNGGSGGQGRGAGQCDQVAGRGHVPWAAWVREAGVRRWRQRPGQREGEDEGQVSVGGWQGQGGGTYRVRGG